jgi:hypothetical protein
MCSIVAAEPNLEAKKAYYLEEKLSSSVSKL